jgi:arylsulfatase A-like enzyme
LRADRLGCYGYVARPTSPVIDALAEESVLFENAITAAPWTTPAHLSLLTSLYPSSHGVTTSFEDLWHGLHFGVGSYYRLPDSRVTLAEALAERGFTTAAFTGGGTVDPAIGFDQGFGLYRTSMFKVSDASFGEMLAWIDANDGRQFFLFWHTFEVHTPYLQPDFVHEVVPGDRGQAIATRTRAIANVSTDSPWPDKNNELLEQQEQILREQHAFNRDVCEALYTGGVRSADRWLGRLIDTLRRLHLYDRTILVVTSDHGEEFADHRRDRWYGQHGHSMYEELIRVPLLIKLPGGYAGGTRVRTVVEAVDVMPTVLDLLRIVPKKNEMQGRSLVPLWAPGARPDQGRTAFVESSKGRGEKKCVRTGQYKYIVKIDAATVDARGRQSLPTGPLSANLYDLRSDPHELRDLLASNPTPAARSIAAELEQRLRRHLAERRGEAEPTQLSPAVLDRLRSLGYVGD